MLHPHSLRNPLPVLLDVSPKAGKTLGHDSTVACEGIGANSEDKKIQDFLHGIGYGKHLGEVEGKVRGTGERNREEEHQGRELRSRFWLAVSRLFRK